MKRFGKIAFLENRNSCFSQILSIIIVRYYSILVYYSDILRELGHSSVYIRLTQSFVDKFQKNSNF